LREFGAIGFEQLTFALVYQTFCHTDGAVAHDEIVKVFLVTLNGPAWFVR